MKRYLILHRDYGIRQKLALFFFIFICCNFSLIARQDSDYAKNRIIVKFKGEVHIEIDKCYKNNKTGIHDLDSLNKVLGLEYIKVIGTKRTRINNESQKEGKILIFIFNRDQDIQSLIKIYLGTGLFEYVEPDYVGKSGGQSGFNVVPTDEYYYRQWGLYNDGTFSLYAATAGADVDMEPAWEIEQGSEDIIVAVLDNGCSYTHPELEGRIWINSGEVDGNMNDDDGNSYADDIHGWDFAYNDNEPDDAYGHGTNVTGIIGATGNNGIGYAGIDWNCKIMLCKILNDEDFGYYSWWADAIIYAVDNGAKVLNMSVGGSGYSELLEDAIDYAYDNDAIVVACMMNENSSTTYYPAGFANSIAVGSTNPDDTRSNPFFWDLTSGSNFGSHIDVVAPGNYIYGLNHLAFNNYDIYWGGTSQATPLVTGLYALLLAQDPSRTPSEIRNILRNSAEDQVGDLEEDTEGWDQYFGYGRVNAYNALSSYLSVNGSSTDIHRMEVYPNPVTLGDEIFIEIENFNNPYLSITDILGKTIYRKSFFSENNEPINLVIPEIGIYFITVHSDGKVYTRKLTVN
ncbi:MAG: S8 family serine peptidase [Bacteroidales bacterium]|nr:S8 family serine peptidase [Bacteroidales bacterium]